MEFGQSKQSLANGTTGRNILAAETESAARSASGAMVDVSGTGLLHKNGGVGTAPAIASDSQVRTAGRVEDYIGSRGLNLVTNGSGLYGNNLNFSQFSFDATELFGGGGSFSSSSRQTVFSEEFIPVNLDRFYELSCFAKSGNTGGGSYNSSERHYIGVVCYDSEKNVILPEYFMVFPGAALTTLSAPLNPGDASIQLTSSAGWQNGGAINSRYFRWYNYQNLAGYVYPDYTLSRNSSRNNPGFNSTLGTWAQGGISGNTITLIDPWTGPALPAGRAVANGDLGGSYKYIAAAGLPVPNNWQSYRGKIGEVDTALSNSSNKFPPGTAFIRLLFLTNFQNLGGNIIRFSNIAFSTQCSENFSAGSINSLQNFTAGLRVGSGGVLSHVLSATKVSTGAPVETLTVTGAQVGDHVLISRGAGAYVSAANTVTFDGTGLSGVTVRATILRVS